ncbi:MAG: DUF1273 family protein [Clostridia bacterium]|nr:DUF1273 family protein [Clostridia bacterium]
MYNTEELQKKLYQTIEKIILENGIKEFWVGNYGVFDKMVSYILNELKKLYDIRIELIIPYLTHEIAEEKVFYNQRFDSITVADIPTTTHYKSKITKTNEYMVDNSEYLICFVDKEWGGAAKALKYAEKKKKNIINIAELN